uniref:U1740u n=1 Tax=Mycobacterium leprae TaxID=1769 RepID=Q50081_MYCLR|nr:u1740u [Mycobacterium leprae]
MQRRPARQTICTPVASQFADLPQHDEPEAAHTAEAQDVDDVSAQVQIRIAAFIYGVPVHDMGSRIGAARFRLARELMPIEGSKRVRDLVTRYLAHVTSIVSPAPSCIGAEPVVIP